jgi:hypothetical protein
VARRTSTSFWNSERIDLAAHRLVLGAAQGEFGAVAHGFHEFVRQQHAVVQVERLAVEIARRLADFEEFLDFRVRDVEIAGAEPRRSEPWLIARSGCPSRARRE